MNRLLIFYKIEKSGGWGMGDWGWGMGDWGLGPIPNPQSPIPNPQSPKIKSVLNFIFYKNIFKKIDKKRFLYFIEN